MLRLGHFTLLPEAFELSQLSFATCNGGSPERFPLAGEETDHGAPVSYLVVFQPWLWNDGWLG